MKGNGMLSDKLAKEKLVEIIKRRTGKDFEKMNDLKEAKLLGSDIRLPARELVLILYDIEEVFGISVSKQAVLDGKFDSYSHIMELVIQQVIREE